MLTTQLSVLLKIARYLLYVHDVWQVIPTSVCLHFRFHPFFACLLHVLVAVLLQIVAVYLLIYVNLCLVACESGNSPLCWFYAHCAVFENQQICFLFYFTAVNSLDKVQTLVLKNALMILKISGQGWSSFPSVCATCKGVHAAFFTYHQARNQGGRYLGHLPPEIFKTFHGNFDICSNFQIIKMKFYILVIFKKFHWNFSLSYW